jgi:hypothetical protein
MPTSRAIVFGLGLLFAFLTLTRSDLDRAAGGVVTLLCLGAVAVASLADRFPRKRLVQLSSSTPPLLLFADRPTREAVDAFHAAVNEAAEAYLQANYPGGGNGLSIVEQIERLHALLTNGAITPNEFDQLKSRLTGSFVGESSGQYL